MKKQVAIFLVFVVWFYTANSQNSIYHLQIDSVAGTSRIDFSRFAGKKILIVNIATHSADTSQLRELSRLQVQQSNLVVVAIPSNSFSNEPYSNDQIANFCRLIFIANFKVAAKTEVTGSNMDSLYTWLTKEENNGLSNSRVRGDFQKYLINEQGHLIGVYDRRIPPLSTVMINAINF